MKFFENPYQKGKLEINILIGKESTLYLLDGINRFSAFE